MIRYLVASLLLFGLPVSPSWGEDCLKLVANKYCLGGDLKKIISTFSDKAEFYIAQDVYWPKQSVGFVDTNVFNYKYAHVSIEGFEGRVSRISIYPDADYYAKPAERLFELKKDTRIVLLSFKQYYPEAVMTDNELNISTENYKLTVRISACENDLLCPLVLNIHYDDLRFLEKAKAYDRRKAGY